MNRLFKIAAFACVLTVGFTACEKDNKTPEDETEQEYQAKVMVKDGETKDLTEVSTTANTEGTISRDGDRYALRNFRQFVIEEDEITEDVATAFYFDFKENDAVEAEEAPLIWTAESRAIGVEPNVAKGYSLSYVDKAFASVTVEDDFVALEEIGIAFSPAMVGWATYDMSTHTIKAIADRTLVLSKDGEPQFKFQIRSIYSDETPNNEVGPTNFVYFSVDYQEFK